MRPIKIRSIRSCPIIVDADEFNPRKQHIAEMIARGLSTAQIAQRLFLSQHTVRD
jgi:DNA-binding NarL/FixJ family response regulator